MSKIQDEIEQYLMGVTNLSRNQLRASLRDAFAPKPVAPKTSDVESVAQQVAPNPWEIKLHHQALPIIKRTEEIPSTPPPAQVGEGNRVGGFTVIRVDPDDEVIKMYENCVFDCTLGDEVP